MCVGCMCVSAQAHSLVTFSISCACRRKSNERGEVHERGASTRSDIQTRILCCNEESDDQEVQSDPGKLGGIFHHGL